VGTVVAVYDRELSALGPGDLPRDRQTESGAAGRSLTAAIQPDESLEDPIPLGSRNPGAVIDDVDDESLGAEAATDVLCQPDLVLDQQHPHRTRPPR
jgi:hypothetical protein